MKIAHIIMLGMTNSGKSTHVPFIMDAFGAPLQIIYPGQLLRQEINAQTPMGKKIAKSVNSGILSNDAAVSKIIKKFDLMQNTLFDGYPRNKNQALEYIDKLEKLRTDNNHTIVPMIIFLRIPKDIAMARALARAKVFTRSDDTANVTAIKIKEFQDKTMPAIDLLCNYGVSIHIIDISAHDILDDAGAKQTRIDGIRAFFESNGF